MNRWVSIAFWSIIAAAFIGPGTVTTAAKAGAGYGPSLLWALAFSTVACLVLQEAAGRLTIASGAPLASALRRRSTSPAGRIVVVLLVLGAVVLGCAAYEAGNILGGVAGARLAFAGTALEASPAIWTLVCGAAAALLLATGTPRRVALGLSCLVAVMGLAFLVTAVLVRPAPGTLVRGFLAPTLPPGAWLLVLGLVGTTVVPYNLFLGSGLAGGQDLGTMRFGLTVAVGLGGLISMGVLVAGSAVEGAFSFEALAEVLAVRLGSWARPLFSFGLFAAGFSSAVTAPLAAALTARGLFSDDAQAEGGGERWGDRSWRYRSVWGGVLAVGLLFGASGVKPIPVIVLAQALNGIVLPVVAVFLLMAVNDRRLMGDGTTNGPLANLLGGLVTLVAIGLGSIGLARAIGSLWPAAPEVEPLAIGLTVVTVVAAGIALWRSG